MECIGGVDVTRGDDFEATIGSRETVLFVTGSEGTWCGRCGSGSRGRRREEGYIELGLEPS